MEIQVVVEDRGVAKIEEMYSRYENEEGGRDE